MSITDVVGALALVIAGFYVLLWLWLPIHVVRYERRLRRDRNREPMA